MRWLLAICLIAAAPAWAEDDDSAALALADKPPLTTARARELLGFLEATVGRSSLRTDPAGTRQDAQLFVGLNVDKPLTPKLRVVLGDLLALQNHDDLLGRHAVNTMIDAYLSWQPRDDAILDAGRINTRYGVGTGFNPTDYFRVNAVRSIVSIDPNSLRANRMGTVMARAQTLWNSGSATAIYAPKLADNVNDAPFSPDWGATNLHDQWLLALSQKLWRGFEPQLLVYSAAGQRPRVGINATALLNNATVLYVEGSAGRSPSLLSQSLGAPDDIAFRSQWATGLTYTSTRNVSVTLEYEYNGAGLDRDQADALQHGAVALPSYVMYRAFAARVQSPPTRQRVFGRIAWTDAIINRLDLASFAYYDVLDNSRQFWVEARYRWTHDLDTAVQAQWNRGDPASDFGALPARWVWQLLATWYF
ncbi:MAG TPA: hypothetical protein VFB54_19915 [Burkholderiales bacterium]|nr:hypothetical protein [Burkholderiales bacterium]